MHNSSWRRRRRRRRRRKGPGLGLKRMKGMRQDK